MSNFIRASRPLIGAAGVFGAACLGYSYTAFSKDGPGERKWVKALGSQPPRLGQDTDLGQVKQVVASLSKGEEEPVGFAETEHSTDHDTEWSYTVSGKKFPLQREFQDKGKKYPVIPLDQVKDNGDHEGEVWVTLDGGVFNVTAFLDAHPGGATRIMMVDGNDLSAFWAVYKLHNRMHIRKLLETYRIGTLSAEDAKKAEEESAFSSYYDSDPERPQEKSLRIPSRHPWNSEPCPSVLVENFYTPNDKFFVRNHNAVPEIDADDWELEIEENPAIGIAERTFTLKELKENFEKVDVVATLQCAGNRQEDFITPDRPLYVAPHWRGSAIGNARWTGVRVRDILRASGMDVDAMALRKKGMAGMKIVNFIAEDTDETGVPYAGVIPIEKVVDPFGDAILAYEMNGETLPRDHGYPVRLLAPGHAGCRNVKWVRQIAVTAEASELDSGSRLDRHFAPDIQWEDHLDHIDPDHSGHCKVRTDQGPVIQTLPVQSVIAYPADRAVLSGKLDSVNVKGVAWSGGGRGICRVELSVDDGETFTAAEIWQCPVARKKMGAPAPEQGMGRNWAWHQFEQDIPIPEPLKEKLANGEKVEMEICCKAVDGDFNVQPEKMGMVWNVLGICSNHWARHKITLDPNVCPKQPVDRPSMPEPGCYIWPGAKE